MTLRRTAWKDSMAARGATVGIGLAAAGYLACVARAWIRYGRPRPSQGRAADALLDRFMPFYDVVERHHIAINAPAAAVLAAAKNQELQRLPIVRGIFRMRQIVMGGGASARLVPAALVPQVLALGWGVLAEQPGREIVIGAITQPWKADVVFRPLSPDDFASFDESGFVKIAWTLRADPLGEHWSMFRTETRAVATDAEARRKFRRYWALASPGISLIRWLSLHPLKTAVEAA